MKKINYFAFLLLLMVATHVAQASDLRGVFPVSDEILQLRFDDGHIDYYGPGGNWWQGADNVVYYSPLDIGAATNTNNYSITDNNSSSWGTVKPSSIGRKSKAGDYNAPNAPNIGNPEYILEHQVYIKLPKKLVSGHSYTLQIGNLADNVNEVTFTFDEKTMRSESVHVNQIGFAQNARKIAYLSHYLGDMGHLDLNAFHGKPFNIVRYSDGQVVHTGTINFRYEHDRTIYLSHNNKPVSMPSTILNNTFADEAEMDFTSFTSTGEYVVSVPGIGCSYPFEIKNSIVNEPFYTAMKGLFYQRACIERELPDGRIYPRDHHPDDFTHYYMPEIVSFHNDGDNGGHSPVENAIKNNTYPLDKPVTGVWGWYHDASDWDSYITHYRIPILLLLLYDLAPDKFYDGEIGNRYKLSSSGSWIDEGNNNIPDILDEAAWLAKFGKRSRQALQSQGYGTGGVPGYIGREGGAKKDGLAGSWQDDRPWIVTGENPSFTMAYAAISAWLAANLNEYHHLTNPGQNHPDYNTWLNEAKSAYDWSINNGGVYGGKGLSGYQTIAAIILYKLTGQTKYRDDVNLTYGVNDNSHYHNEASSIPMGFVSACLVEMNPGLDFSADVKYEAEKELKHQANGVVSRTENMGLRYGGFDEQGYGLGMFSTPHITMPAVKYIVSGDEQYMNCVMDNLSYVCGGNQLNFVYLSQLGENPQNMAIHHIDSWNINDYTGPVYQWDCVPGVATYFGDKANWVGGIGSHVWTRGTAYPLHDNSPRSEMNFPNRESINGSEYTTQQNIAAWAFAAGFVKAMYGNTQTSPSHNARPNVSLNLTNGQSLPAGSTVSLTANAAWDTRKVAYYYDWHYIGESYDAANDFMLNWDISQ